jgi:hypothetical protein
MQSDLHAALRAEEASLTAELRATATYRRLRAVRRVIDLYGAGAAAADDPDEVFSAGPARAAEDGMGASWPRPTDGDGRETEEAHSAKVLSVVRAALGS